MCSGFNSFYCNFSISLVSLNQVNLYRMVNSESDFNENSMEELNKRNELNNKCI